MSARLTRACVNDIRVDHLLVVSAGVSGLTPLYLLTYKAVYLLVLNTRLLWAYKAILFADTTLILCHAPRNPLG